MSFSYDANIFSVVFACVTSILGLLPAPVVPLIALIFIGELFIIKFLFKIGNSDKIAVIA